MSDSIVSGVCCNLSVTLQNMFTPDRIEKVRGYSQNITDETTTTELAYNIFHILFWSTQALNFFGKRPHESMHSSLKKKVERPTQEL